MNNMNRKFQTGLGILIVAIVFLFILGGDAISLLKSPIELDDILDVDKVAKLKDGDHVILKVKLTFGAEIGVYTTKNGVKQGESSRYYIIPFYGETEADYFCLLVDVAKKDFSKMEQAYDTTEKWDNGEIEWPTQTYATFEGVMKKFSSDEKKYMQDYVDEGYCAALVLKQKAKGFTFIASGAAILGVLIGLLLVVLGLKQGKVEKANQKALAATNYYQAPTNVSFNNDPNAAQAQGGFNPYGVQNDPRFAGAVNQAQNAAPNVTSFNEVQTGVQEAATTSFNEVQNTAQNAVNNAVAEASSLSDQIPITPITPLTPIDPIDTNNNNQ